MGDYYMNSMERCNEISKPVSAALPLSSCANANANFNTSMYSSHLPIHANHLSLTQFPPISSTNLPNLYASSNMFATLNNPNSYGAEMTPGNSSTAPGSGISISSISSSTFNSYPSSMLDSMSPAAASLLYPSMPPTPCHATNPLPGTCVPPPSEAMLFYQSMQMQNQLHPGMKTEKVTNSMYPPVGLPRVSSQPPPLSLSTEPPLSCVKQESICSEEGSFTSPLPASTSCTGTTASASKSQKRKSLPACNSVSVSSSTSAASGSTPLSHRPTEALFIRLLLPSCCRLAPYWFKGISILRERNREESKRANSNAVHSSDMWFDITDSIKGGSVSQQNEVLTNLLKKLYKELPPESVYHFLLCWLVPHESGLDPKECVLSRPDLKGKMRRIDGGKGADKVWRLDTIVGILFHGLPLASTDTHLMFHVCGNDLCIRPQHLRFRASSVSIALVLKLLQQTGYRIEPPRNPSTSVNRSGILHGTSSILRLQERAENNADIGSSFASQRDEYVDISGPFNIEEMIRLQTGLTPICEKTVLKFSLSQTDREFLNTRPLLKKCLVDMPTDTKEQISPPRLQEPLPLLSHSVQRPDRDSTPSTSQILNSQLSAFNEISAANLFFQQRRHLQPSGLNAEISNEAKSNASTSIQSTEPSWNNTPHLSNTSGAMNLIVLPSSDDSKDSSWVTTNSLKSEFHDSMPSSVTSVLTSHCSATTAYNSMPILTSRSIFPSLAAISEDGNTCTASSVSFPNSSENQSGRKRSFSVKQEYGKLHLPSMGQEPLSKTSKLELCDLPDPTGAHAAPLSSHSTETDANSEFNFPRSDTSPSAFHSDVPRPPKKRPEARTPTREFVERPVGPSTIQFHERSPFISISSGSPSSLPAISNGNNSSNILAQPAPPTTSSPFSVASTIANHITNNSTSNNTNAAVDFPPPLEQADGEDCDSEDLELAHIMRNEGKLSRQFGRGVQAVELLQTGCGLEDDNKDSEDKASHSTTPTLPQNLSATLDNVLQSPVLRAWLQQTSSAGTSTPTLYENIMSLRNNYPVPPANHPLSMENIKSTLLSLSPAFGIRHEPQRSSPHLAHIPNLPQPNFSTMGLFKSSTPTFGIGLTNLDTSTFYNNIFQSLSRAASRNEEAMGTANGGNLGLFNLGLADLSQCSESGRPLSASLLHAAMAASMQRSSHRPGSGLFSDTLTTPEPLLQMSTGCVDAPEDDTHSIIDGNVSPSEEKTHLPPLNALGLTPTKALNPAPSSNDDEGHGVVAKGT